MNIYVFHSNEATVCLSDRIACIPMKTCTLYWVTGKDVASDFKIYCYIFRLTLVNNTRCNSIFVVSRTRTFFILVQVPSILIQLGSHDRLLNRRFKYMTVPVKRNM